MASFVSDQVCYAYYEDLLDIPTLNVLSVCPVCNKRVASHPHRPISSPSPVKDASLLSRELSTRSEDILAQLNRLSTELDYYKKCVRDLEEKMGSGDFLSSKHELAQLVGSMERFLDNKVDAVIVSECDSGRQDARDRKKLITNEVEELVIQAKHMHELCSSMQSSYAGDGDNPSQCVAKNSSSELQSVDAHHVQHHTIDSGGETNMILHGQTSIDDALGDAFSTRGKSNTGDDFLEVGREVFYQSSSDPTSLKAAKITVADPEGEYFTVRVIETNQEIDTIRSHLIY
mmetsp:Transcript_9020/g.13558  ORF Transcript_9020/g.13558 Transcript_9020/m.13558 type:complete len:288 (+) Transcript_9020:85-948(+)